MFTRVRAVSQHFHFGTSLVLLIARGLGAESFGRLMIFQAITQLALQLVGLGAGEAFIRRVARDQRGHKKALGHAVLLTLITGTALAIVVSGLGGFWDSTVRPEAIAVFAFGELVGNRLGAVAEHVFIGHLKAGLANVVRLTLTAVKLASVVILMYGFGFNTLSDWMLVQGLSTLASGVACLMFAMARLGALSPAFDREALNFGVLMTVTQFSQSIQFNADRLALGLITDPSVVAVYSAATRGVQFALIPIQAILRNIFGNFFSAGENGIAASWYIGLVNLPKVLIIGAIVGLILFAGADLFARILGPGFANTAFILRWLSGVAFLQGTQYVLADVLTGSDYQVWRTIISALGALIYIATITILAFLWGIMGLIAAIYLSQFTMIVAYWYSIQMLVRYEGKDGKGHSLASAVSNLHVKFPSIE